MPSSFTCIRVINGDRNILESNLTFRLVMMDPYVNTNKENFIFSVGHASAVLLNNCKTGFCYAKNTLNEAKPIGLVSLDKSVDFKKSENDCEHLKKIALINMLKFFRF